MFLSERVVSVSLWMINIALALAMYYRSSSSVLPFLSPPTTVADAPSLLDTDMKATQTPQEVQTTSFSFLYPLSFGLGDALTAETAQAPPPIDPWNPWGPIYYFFFDAIGTNLEGGGMYLAIGVIAVLSFTVGVSLLLRKRDSQSPRPTSFAVSAAYESSMPNLLPEEDQRRSAIALTQELERARHQNTLLQVVAVYRAQGASRAVEEAVRLEKEVGDLHMALATLRTQLSAGREECLGAQNAKREMTEQANMTGDQKERELRAKLEQLEARESAAVSALANTTKALTESEAREKAATEKMLVSTHDAKIVAEQCAAVQAQCEGLIRSLTEAHTREASIKVALHEVEARHEYSNLKSSESIADLQAQIIGSRAQLEVSQRELQATTVEKATLSEELKHTQSQLQSAMTSLQSLQTSTEEGIQHHLSQLKESQNNVAALKAHVETLRKTIDGQTILIGETKSREENSAKALHEFKQQHATTLARFQDMEKELRETKANLEYAQKRSALAQEDITAARDAEMQLDTFKKYAEELKAKIIELAGKYERETDTWREAVRSVGGTGVDGTAASMAEGLAQEVLSLRADKDHIVAALQALQGQQVAMQGEQSTSLEAMSEYCNVLRDTLFRTQEALGNTQLRYEEKTLESDAWQTRFERIEGQFLSLARSTGRRGKHFNATVVQRAVRRYLGRRRKRVQAIVEEILVASK